MSTTMFDQEYPYLASWILDADGWIEVGRDDFSRSLVRILDTGGMIWESDEHYPTVAEALAAAELALAGHRETGAAMEKHLRQDVEWGLHGQD